MAYQVYAGGLDHEFAAHVSAFVTRGAPTDLTIVFDVPVEMGLARRHRGGQVNRIDEKSLGFHRRVRDGYLKLAEDHGFQVIDASGTPEQVEAAAWDLIFPLIAERYPDIILARQEVK
jgi:dTMP kinase